MFAEKRNREGERWALGEGQVIAGQYKPRTGIASMRGRTPQNMETSGEQWNGRQQQAEGVAGKGKSGVVKVGKMPGERDTGSMTMTGRQTTPAA